MIRLIKILALIGLAQSFIVMPQAGAAQNSGDPTIASVTVKSVAPQGALNRYTISATVVNNGGMPQPKDTLQFVNIYQEAGEKLDAKGIPPLNPGESYTFTWSYVRSRDAGNGTTKLSFELAPALGSSSISASTLTF
jgi:hypothetical protein